MPRSALEGALNPEPLWTWDGNIERPTFDPSYLVMLDGNREGRLCHSYIRNGCWEFLGDCYHALAGQTVDLPPLPDWLVH